MTCLTTYSHTVSFGSLYEEVWASQVVLAVKNLPANAGDIRDVGLMTGSGRFPREGNGNPPTPVFLPGEFHGKRNLLGYS